MNNKITLVIEGLIFAVIGALISIFGPTEVIDKTTAIIALILGSVLVLLALVFTFQKKEVDISSTILGAVLIFIGAFLLTPWLTFGVLINFLVIVLMGLGAGLILVGLIALAKKATTLGIVQIIIGALLVVFTGLYLGVDGFRNAFWIIIGIVIAIYGALLVVDALISNKPKKKQK